MSFQQPQGRLAFAPGGRAFSFLLGTGCACVVLIIVLVAWITDASGLRFNGLSEFGTIALACVIALVGATLAALLAASRMYFSPKSNAIRKHLSRVDILGGRGELILWGPRETYIFLKNRRVIHLGDEHGGSQAILHLFGEEAIGPISLKTDLLTWNIADILTREAQAIEVILGIWWKVEDPHQYAFGITSEIQGDFAGQLAADFKAGTQLASENTVIDPRKPAAKWLYVWVESAVRGYVNRLGMAEVVSSQASKWLQVPSDNAGSTPAANRSFDEIEKTVLSEVAPKAREYGIRLEKLAVQGIRLPKQIQDVIDRTREAFLLPIQSEQEAQARYIRLKRELEASRDVLGSQTFELNELLKNFRGANFGNFPEFLHAIFSRVDQKAIGAAAGVELSIPPAGHNGEPPIKPESK
jgi:regulator of protease activity HflC (stomatin/prohibitin superfamily)